MISKVDLNQVSESIARRLGHLIAVERKNPNRYAANYDYTLWFASRDNLAARLSISGASIAAFSVGCRATPAELARDLQGNPAVVVGPLP